MKINGKKLCEDIIGKPEKETFDGANKLRAVVQWMNGRKETLNQNKSVLNLIAEYYNENI